MPQPPLNIAIRQEQQPDADNVSIVSGRGMPGKPTQGDVTVSTRSGQAQDPGTAAFAVYTGTGRILTSSLTAAVIVAGAGIESYRSLVSSLQAAVTVSSGNPQVYIYTSLGEFNPISVDIRRAITDVTWTMSAEFAGIRAPAMHRHMRYQAIDADGNPQWLFTGIVPDRSYKMQVAETRTSVNAYDYGFFLSQQQVPYDETTMDLQGDYSSWDEWITHLLEGTKILPHRINPCSAEDTEFSFTPKTTKIEAARKIAKYTDFIFYVYWINKGTDDKPQLRPAAYFVHIDDIDDPTIGLDLPAPYTVTIDDTTLIDIPDIQTIADEEYNRVIVRGNDGGGTWYTAIEETAEVTNGDEVAREYYEEESRWNTQAKTDARATDLLGFFTTDRYKVRATFIKRHNLRPWQKIRFQGPGFPDSLTDMGWLRITNIQHRISHLDDTVQIEAVPDTNINLEWLENTNDDSVTETETIVDNKIETRPGPQIGTVTAIDGNTATVETERGDIIKARIVE